MPKASSVVDYIRQVLARAPLKGRVAAHRGHSGRAFLLQPSVFRKASSRENEHLLLRELIAAHPSEFSSDGTALEQLVRMQHYSLPTRLLDVTWNPLVALYFACQSHRERMPAINKAGKRVLRMTEVDGEVVTLSVPKSRVRYFDSDQVSLIANLARLRYSLKQKLDWSLLSNDFNGSMPVRRLLHFVRQEKYQFEPEIIPSHLRSIVLVKPKQNNRRILAQDGAFFIFGEVDEILATNSNLIRIRRINIPAGCKNRMLSDLDKLAINEKTLFPEIDRAARYITDTTSAAAVLAGAV